MILIPAILSRYGSRADNSFSVSFVTNELSSEQILSMNKLKSKYGFLMFKDSEVEKADTEIMNGLDADLSDPSKTPSKRLRSVLYLNHQQDSKGHTDFKDYYKSEMERIIDHYKKKLD
jgi:hypothetical protein